MGKLRLPLAWQSDDVEDDACDELNIWPTFGKDETLRDLTNNKICESVFSCLPGDPGFVELKNLYDGLETCDNEIKIC